MRTRHIVFFVAAAAAFLPFVGCSKRETWVTDFCSDPDAVRVEASVVAITRTNPLGGDESDKFSDGDKISVTNGLKTLRYKFDGNSWSPENAADYLLWDTPVTFRAWYPANASGEFFRVPGVQGFGYSLKDADYMTSDACTYSSFGDIPKDRTFRPVLKRRMALVTVIVDIVGGQYDYLKDRYISVSNIRSGYEFIKIQSDGTFKSEGTPVSIYPDSYEIDGKRAYSAIVAPGAAIDGEIFLAVRIWGYEDEEKQVKVDKNVFVTGIPAAEAGKHYTYRLIVGKETVKIGGVTVEDWTTGGKLDDKFEAESDGYSEWDGKKVTYSYSFFGSGTSESPYLIKSATDLAGLSAMVNGGKSYSDKCFRLETNIDLMGHEWTPIGNKNKPFSGTFDGNSKIITNMSISVAPSPGSGAGLFGNCSGASVSNVVLKNARITYSGESSFSAGLICGVFSGVVKNCRVEGNIITKSGHCGGIIGEIDGGASVSDSEVEIHCENPWGISGGIVGYCFQKKLTIESCIVKGEINGGNYGFGGIAGSLNGSNSNVLVKNCTSYVRLGKAMEGTHPKVGGLVGLFSYGKAENCTVYGGISFTYDSCSAGGMFSEAYGVTLSNLNFSGDIDVTIQGSSAMQTYIGVFIAWLGDGGGTTTAAGCTYKKSGAGNYPVVGGCDDDSFDTTALDIKGI